MTGYEIRKKRDSISRRIAKAYGEMIKLQGQCAHPSTYRSYCSNTGNYDPSADIYWIDVNCDDCGKKWTEEQ